MTQSAIIQYVSFRNPICLALAWTCRDSHLSHLVKGAGIKLWLKINLKWLGTRPTCPNMCRYHTTVSYGYLFLILSVWMLNSLQASHEFFMTASGTQWHCKGKLCCNKSTDKTTRDIVNSQRIHRHSTVLDAKLFICGSRDENFQANVLNMEIYRCKYACFRHTLVRDYHFNITRRVL